MTSTADQLSELCASALSSGPPPSVVARLERIRSRLREPLRVAIAGRVKAGKSTLLNALVGEKLAASDAAECTRVPTWYRDGLTYSVTAALESGEYRPLEFRRDDGRLQIDLGGLAVSEIDRIDVSWPSSRLATTTLLDTPGLTSSGDPSDSQSRDVLGLTDERDVEVDAVIYLMRHAHKSDIDFLEAFVDRSVVLPSAVGSIAVLSRADEIGAARQDAVTSARAIAERYAADPRIRSRCTGVVAVAALLAEAGATLREDQTRALGEIAKLPDAELEGLLLSVDRFTMAEFDGVGSDLRRSLLMCLGLFGVRFSVDALRTGRASTTPQLARELIGVSGVPTLIGAIDEHFSRRAQQLKVRSAIRAMKSATRLWSTTDPVVARSIAAGIEQIEASASEIIVLRLVRLMASSEAELSDREQAEIRELTVDDGVTRGVAPSGTASFREDLLSRITYWRVRAEDPMASPTVQEAAQSVVRLYEARVSNFDGGRRQLAALGAPPLNGNPPRGSERERGGGHQQPEGELVHGNALRRPAHAGAEAHLPATGTGAELQRLNTYAVILLVTMCVAFVGATALGFVFKSVVLPIEAVAAFFAATFAQVVKGFAVTPTPDAVREARKLLRVVVAIWGITFIVSSLISFSALNLIDGALWLFAIAFMRSIVSSMARVVATLR